MEFDISVGTLLLFPLIAVSAPLLVRLVGRVVAIPLVVFEIVLGLVFGPAVLGWIEPGEVTEALSDFGLAMLFFLAGNEIDFRAIRGRPIRRAGLGWLASLVLGIGIALLLAPSPTAAVFIGVALTSTALGTIMPVLRDAGDLKSPFGVAAIAVGAIGEFGPLLAISLFLGSRQPLTSALVVLAFAVIAGLGIWLASRGVGKRLHRAITETLHTSGQFAIRLVVLVLLALVALSIVLGLDMLLGAFTAGVIYRLLLSGAPEHDVEVVEGKLEAVGYGLLVPFFFINTGVTFDLAALTSDPMALALIPVFLALFLVIRGIPSSFAAPPGASFRDRAATALLGATALPIIVAVTAIGVEDGVLTSGIASSLVGAGMCSVLVFPLVALVLRRRRPDAPSTDAPPPGVSDGDVFVPTEG
ncbi:cation:proton antiporter [Agromyces sp. CFH 90414]|uniref:Cation:proton antiporter n=1 Tax=Agromyces agglutinans TaxID=2662258 RepID=A0A6I2F2B5_9MICO|nr:cation:proton antiporter [Agromyces agglutinans]MRG58642.1 cation:proton antiporter [Agromyces agglutinans]